jgi:hypothetical protein
MLHILFNLPRAAVVNAAASLTALGAPVSPGSGKAGRLGPCLGDRGTETET